MRERDDDVAALERGLVTEGGGAARGPRVVRGAAGGGVVPGLALAAEAATAVVAALLGAALVVSALTALVAAEASALRAALTAAEAATLTAAARLAGDLGLGVAQGGADLIDLHLHHRAVLALTGGHLHHLRADHLGESLFEAALVACAGDGVLAGSGGSFVAVVDAVRGVSNVDVLLTHHHDDHEGGAARLVELLSEAGGSARVWGGDQGIPLVDGQIFDDVQVVLAPGHTADSVAYVFERDGDVVLFSGDTLLGGSSSFIAHPDGDLTDAELARVVAPSVAYVRTLPPKAPK